MNYWPGFVDALSTLILGIIFLLTVFVVVQFYLQQEVAGKDTALQQLNAQIAQLTSLLSMEKTGKADLENQLAALRASLAGAESDRDKYKSAGRQRRRRHRRRARQGQRTLQRSSKARRSSPPRRCRKSKSSTSRSPRCAASWPRSSRRSMPPRRTSRTRRPKSPISASASTSRWRRRCSS